MYWSWYIPGTPERTVFGTIQEQFSDIFALEFIAREALFGSLTLALPFAALHMGREAGGYS